MFLDVFFYAIWRKKEKKDFFDVFFFFLSDVVFESGVGGVFFFMFVLCVFVWFVCFFNETK